MSVQFAVAETTVREIERRHKERDMSVWNVCGGCGQRFGSEAMVEHRALNATCATLWFQGAEVK